MAIMIEDIPSRRRDLLTSMRGARVTRMTRCSWSPKHTVARESNIAPELVFSRTAGPLLVTLESGLVIGVASQPSLVSVTLWRGQPPYSSGGSELHPIEAEDPGFTEPG